MFLLLAKVGLICSLSCPDLGPHNRRARGSSSSSPPLALPVEGGAKGAPFSHYTRNVKFIVWLPLTWIVPSPPLAPFGAPARLNDVALVTPLHYVQMYWPSRGTICHVNVLWQCMALQCSELPPG